MSSQPQRAVPDELRSLPTKSSPRSWSERPWSRAPILQAVPCAVAALVYIATLSFGFVYDDVPQILKNPAIQSWSSLPQYFTSHVWAAIYPNSTGNYYRPLFLLWLRLNYALFGTDAAGWHLSSIACHVLATWLVFRVAQKLTADHLTAFLAALVFAVHPAHIENVAWISGVTDPLMACFVLASFLGFLSFQESRKLGSAIFSLALFALALLSKETAAVLPVLVFAYVLFFGKENQSAGPARRLIPAIRQSMPFLLVLLLYGTARYHALGWWSHATIPVGWKEVLLTWPSVLWFYIRHSVFPVSLSEFYALDYVGLASARAVFSPLILVTLSVTAVILLARSLSQKKVAYSALVLCAAPLLPVLDLRSLTVGDIVHDRYLYLPSVGFALLVALALRELARRVSDGRLRILPIALAVATILGFAALTVAEQMPWSNDISLYTRGLNSAPGNLTVRDNLANALLNASQPERAIPLYLQVLGRNPNFWRSNYNLGFAYYKTGNFAGAEHYLQRAVALDPTDSDQYIYLGLVQLQLKKFSEAAENAQHAIALNPHARGYHSALALIYEGAGNVPGAETELKTEVTEHPENAAAIGELQRLNQGHPTSRP